MNTNTRGMVVKQEVATKFITNIDPADVVSVYSGRPGCACGCRGKHTYNPKHQKLGSKQRGYEVEDYECSVRSITTILNKVKALNETGAETDGVYPEVLDGNIVHVELANRLYIVYLVDSAAL